MVLPGMGADDAVFADNSAIEDCRADADQGAVGYGAAMQDGHVTDGAICADCQRESHIGVGDTIVLKI